MATATSEKRKGIRWKEHGKLLVATRCRHHKQTDSSFHWLACEKLLAALKLSARNQVSKRASS